MLTNSYEQLREVALTGMTLTSRHWGWNLLRMRGLTAWIDAWRSLEPQPVCPTFKISPVTEPVLLPDPVQQQITAVLAEMILQSRISA